MKKLRTFGFVTEREGRSNGRAFNFGSLWIVPQKRIKNFKVFKNIFKS
jgi:hypothetical protein